MSTFTKFEDISAWQKARSLTKRIYQVSGRGEFSRDYSFRDQIRSSGVSIMANISEGFEREGNKEFIQFLSIAKASASELRSHLYVAKDVNYISEDDFADFNSDANELSRMIGGLMNYLKASPIKGRKFKLQS
jgi:four helix bundle protein